MLCGQLKNKMRKMRKENKMPDNKPFGSVYFFRPLKNGKYEKFVGCPCVSVCVRAEIKCHKLRVICDLSCARKYAAYFSDKTIKAAR